MATGGRDDSGGAGRIGRTRMPWFAANRSGPGRHPVSWQGWLVILVAVAAVVAVVAVVVILKAGLL